MKNIKLILVTSFALLMSLSVNFNADELVTRDTVPNSADYAELGSEYAAPDYSEKIKELYNQTQKDLDATKRTKSSEVNPTNIFDLLDIAYASLDQDSCTNIASDFTCVYNANYDGNGNNELTFKYSANNDFKVIARTNSSNQLTYLSRYAYGVQKYGIYYDVSSGEIVKTVTYVYGKPELTTTFVNKQAVLFEYRFYQNGYLFEHIIIDDNDLLSYYGQYYSKSKQLKLEAFFEISGGTSKALEVNNYYTNGKYSRRFIYENGIIKLALEYNEKGIKTLEVNYISGIVTTAKLYYQTGELKIYEKYDSKGRAVYSKGYSQSGILQNYYTYYTNGNINSVKLYNTYGKQVYKRDNYSNGTRKMIAKYNSGVVTVRNYYDKYGKRTIQHQYTSGKLTQRLNYDKYGNIVIRRIFKTDGKLTTKTIYTNGKKVETRQYHTNGNTKSILKFDSRERKVSLVTYDTSGQKIKYVAYNTSGSITKVVYYKDGKIVSVKYY